MDFGKVLMPFKKNGVYLKSIPDQKGWHGLGGPHFSINLGDVVHGVPLEIYYFQKYFLL